MGPILFTLYANDTLSAVSSKPRLFADDTSIFCFDANISRLKQTVNTELGKLHEWLNANKLLVNTSKTHYSIIAPSARDIIHDSTTILMGEELKQKEEIKYLGIKIDDKLSLEKHVNKIKNEIVKFCSIFAKLRYSVTNNCLMTLYDSLVTSKIGYALEVYGVS